MSEIEMITEVWPDLDLPGPAELRVARDRLNVAIAADRMSGSVPAAAPGRPRRGHQRRIALLGAAFTGTAVAAAAAVLVATPGPDRVQRPVGSAGPPRTAAYVIRHAEQALASAERANLIEKTRSVAHAAWFTLPPRSSRSAAATQTVSWWYRGQSRVEGRTAAGKPVFDASTAESYTPHHATITSQTVNYTTRTWWRGHATAEGPTGSLSPPRSCQVASAPDPTGAPGTHWAAQIRLALSCRNYRVAGTAVIDGVDTVELIYQYRQERHNKYFRRSHTVAQTVWVSRATYLPVRVRWTWPRLHGLPDGSLTGDFTWLKPTKANLASLRVPVPAAFRQIRAPAVLPVVAPFFTPAPDDANVVWPTN